MEPENDDQALSRRQALEKKCQTAQHTFGRQTAHFQILRSTTRCICHATNEGSTRLGLGLLEGTERNNDHLMEFYRTQVHSHAQ